MSDPEGPALIPLSRVWKLPDPLLVDAGAGGELLVARVRLALLGTLLVIPLINVFQDPYSEENYVGLTATLVALLVAGILYLLVKQGFYRRWLGFVSSAADVSMVSGALVAFLVLETPHTAVNSKVVFEVYFLAIGATSLRYDARICLVACALAMLQYLAIVGYADTRWDLNGTEFWPFPYGEFSWSSQVARILLLGAAGALSTAVVRRSRRLRQMSARDRLTGLVNRGYFDARVQAELIRAERHNRPLALAMVDVDHFKRFNDSFGHAAGDIALRTIAQTLVDAVRGSDIVARYGGEEFVVVLPETDPAAGVEKLETLRLAVAQTLIQLPKHQMTASLTVSAGVACYPGDGNSPGDLIDRADARLFQAKETGRNRVVGPPEVPSPLGLPRRASGGTR